MIRATVCMQLFSSLFYITLWPLTCRVFFYFKKLFRTRINFNTIQLGLKVCFFLFVRKRNSYNKWKVTRVHSDEGEMLKTWRSAVSSLSCRFCDQRAPGVTGLVAVWG